MEQDERFNAKQMEAISERGGQILVAAAAGSGKTSVLVERLYRQMVGHRVHDLSEFLIITFTNDAAGELKERIGKRLRESILAEQAGDGSLESLRLIGHMQKQISMLPQAKVSTIHGFCGDLLREHGHLIGVNPSFGQLDDTETQLIQNEVLEQTLIQWYQYGATGVSPEFYKMMDYFSEDRWDETVSQMILELYGQIQSEPNPMAWLEGQKQYWTVDGLDSNEKKHEFLFSLPWVRGYLSYMAGEVEKASEEMRQFVASQGNYPKLAKLGQGALSDFQLWLEMIESVLAGTWTGSWNDMVAGFALKLRRLTKPSDEEKARNEIRKSIEKRVLALQQFKLRKPLLEEISSMAPHVLTLIEVVKGFDRAYRKEKDRRNVLDFADLEHYTVELLVKEDASRSALAESVARQFVEVMVDEYQDTNLVQNTIFSAVARKDEKGQDLNLFFVGDVKQSIYSFRLADPSIFSGHFREFSQKAGEFPRSILLETNYRSRDEVIHACNDFFQEVMTEGFGQTNYARDGMLVRGGAFPPVACAVDESCAVDEQKTSVSEGSPYDLELDLLDCSTYDMEHLSGGEHYLEAMWIAKRIHHMVASKFQVRLNEEETRDLKYGDILILIRSPKGLDYFYESAMAELGIPFVSSKGESIFQSMEVRVAWSFLKLIDNPLQDIPLASVLRSPLFGFTSDELVLLRQGGEKYYYQALLNLEQVICFEQDGKQTTMETAEGLVTFCPHGFCHKMRGEVLPPLLEKKKRFLDLLTEFRRAQWELSGEELLWYVMEKTSMMGIFGSMRDGEKRQARLMEFYRIVGTLTTGGQGSLFSVLKKLADLEKIHELPQGNLGLASEDVVELKSVHKAKGLEKPLVFVAGLKKAYNVASEKQPLLFHSRDGLGPRYFEPKQRYFRTTLVRHGIGKSKRRDLVSEELRLMYVAMTRAQEKLIMTISSKNMGKELLSAGQRVSYPLNGTTLSECKNMSEIVLTYGLSRKDGAFLWKELDMKPEEAYGFDTWTGREKSCWKMNLISAGDELESVAAKERRLKEEEIAKYMVSPEGTGTEHFDDLGKDKDWWLGLEAVCRERYEYDFFRTESLIPSKFTATQLKGRALAGSVQEEADLSSVVVEDEEYFDLELSGDSGAEMSDYMAAFYEVDGSNSGGSGVEDEYFSLSQEEADNLAVCQEEYLADYGQRDTSDCLPMTLENDVGGSGQFVEGSQVSEGVDPSYPPELSIKERKKRDRHPEFLEVGKKELSPSQRGDAIHLAMQYLEFGSLKDCSLGVIRGKMDELLRDGKLSSQQRAVVSEEKMMTFLQSEWGIGARNALECHQEFKFSILVSGDMYHYDTTEKMLLQGVVDCWYEVSPGELVVIDFKSGRVPLKIPNIMEKKAQEHQVQMEVYRSALAEITGKKVVKTVLWFFEVNLGVEVPEIEKN